MVFRDSFRMNNKGFTIVELMVVIIVIGLLAGVVTVNVSAQLATRKHKIFAEEIMADLRSARQEAISREEEVEVRFRGGPPHEDYIIVVKHGLGGTNDEERLKKVIIPKGMSVKVETPSTRNFTFETNGNTDNGTISLENENEQRYYCIVYQTGRIRLSDKAPQ